ncbi:uncharacterized protein EDB91DRAFT_1216743 [Suillus paluster]|uniref:uncharacterized protein n=1 Tax=Suillus paluster TaxID=48578 RepID=UPI001B87FFBA|nr:uncharacterized protein EDB91DRAFT_1216743 [Suillus paluster]KAG1751465.1 hypothetical protein EDB91DRAFT_1216743 [Suillus paluster]
MDLLLESISVYPSQRVMHPALRNLEVIYTISSYTERRSLPALAATCRAFEHPALNALWRDLQSLDPLIRCLPNDLFDRDQGIMILKKPLDNDMWETLSSYTSRVHSFTQSGNLTGIELLGELMLSCPLTPASLFPNLRKLTWNGDGTHSAAEILRMASVPTLVELDVWMTSTSSAFVSVLSSIGTLCPRLQNMELRLLPVECTRKVSPFIIQTLSQLQHLHTLAVWDLGNQGIQQIMQLPALQSLNLDLKTSSAWETRSHLQFPGFHPLNLFGMSIDSFERASNFWGSLQVVKSREIAVGFTSQAAQSPAMLSQFFTIMQERCDNDTLLRFLLHGFSSKVHTEWGVFTSLHAYRNLTGLRIDTGCKISISDDELCQLVRGWPKLRTLEISRCVSIDTTTVPTFHGITRLLQLCPALSSLGLVIDTTKLEGIDLNSPYSWSYNRLQCLTLGNSLIESPPKVALILSCLFPLIRRVELRCWYEAPMNSLLQRKSEMESWASVNSILRGVLERRFKAYRDLNPSSTFSLARYLAQ